MLIYRDMCHRITLRPMVAGDVVALFKWKNDPLALAMSRCTVPVEWPTHFKWAMNSLNREDCTILVADLDRPYVQPVGCVRLDRLKEGAELSWNVAPSHRGMGIGSLIVSTAVSRNRSAELFAEIKPENHASQRIAEKAGLALCHERDGLLVFKYCLPTPPP